MAGTARRIHLREVPANTSALVLARFTAASRCVGEKTSGCLIRVLVGDQEADPALGDSSYFDSAPNVAVASNDADSFESHSIERSLGPLAAGTYSVHVQFKNQIGSSFQLEGWNFTVERFRA
jgi:hypothetical protein